MTSWYQQVKQAMSETQVGNEMVVSENHQLIGAAVRYQGKIFVAPAHPIAWMLGSEHPTLGSEISEVYEAGLNGNLDLDRWEGFMTTDGFKTRPEALSVARQSNQLNKEVLPGQKFHSEDVKNWAQPSAAVTASLNGDHIYRTAA